MQGELIDLSAMGALRELVLSVVAHPLSIMYLALLLNSLSVPTTHLLKLGLYIDDRNLAREVDWVAVISRDRASLSRYGRIMDAKLYSILSAYADTRICFRLSDGERTDLAVAEEVLESLIPHTVQSSRFEFDYVGDECE
jgi:hypothetical protein